MELEERTVSALESIRDSFASIAYSLTALQALQQDRFEREFPSKTKKEANVTHKLTDEEILERKISGDPNEPLEWIGEREREVISLESSERAGAESKKS